MMVMTPTYPSWIDDGSDIPDPLGYGERAVNFLRNLKHPKSRQRGQAFTVDPWLERKVRRIYGPRHTEDDPENFIFRGDRIVKTVFDMVPRGARKTSIGAALTLLHTIGPEKRDYGQVVCAAADKKQASIAFNEAASIIRIDKRFNKLVKVTDHTKLIRNLKTGTKLEAISADGATQHGRTPSFVLADELHAWKDHTGLWEALKTGLAKEDNSLLVITTTAGRGQSGAAWDQYQYARDVALGKIINPSYLPILFEAPKDCDWRDERIWFAVNPGLKHGYPNLANLRELAREAEHRPAERESFRQLHLNIWLQNWTTPFVDLDLFDRGAVPQADLPALLDRLKGQPCWVALDMSVTTDLTAIVAVFRDPDDDEAFIAIPHLFCPRDALREKADKDGVPYPTWAEQGHLFPTPGSVVDYARIVECIRDLCATYEVQEIVYDRAYAQPVIDPLLQEGLPVIQMDLSPRTQSGGIFTLERAITGGKLRHTGNPVLRWNFENVQIYTGPSGLRTMHKGKSKGRIDGAFACWMAVSRAASGETHSWGAFADPDFNPAEFVI